MKKQLLMSSLLIVILFFASCSLDELTGATNDTALEERVIASLENEDFDAVEQQLKEAKDISSSEVLVLARKLLYAQQDLTRAWEKGDFAFYEEALIKLGRLDEQDWTRSYRQSLEPQFEALQNLEDMMKKVERNEEREEYITAISHLTEFIHAEDAHIQQLVTLQRKKLNERLDELTESEQQRMRRVEEEKKQLAQNESIPKRALERTPVLKQQTQSNAQPTEEEELQQLEEEYQTVDHELNRLWGILKANLSESEFTFLVQEQRQWIEEKEAHANSEYNRAGGGTMGEIYRHIRLIYFTEERIEELQMMYND